MHSIETYSRYIHQLVKDGKYENALINFQENAVNFSKDEVANNRFLIKDLLKSYKEQNQPLDAIKFIDDFEIKIYELNDNYAVGYYGWILFSILKNSATFTLEDVEKAADKTIDLLCKINICDPFHKLLVTQLLSKIILLEKKKNMVTIDRAARLLKGIDIKNDDVKEIISSDPYIVAGIMDIFRKSNHVEKAFDFLKFLKIEIYKETPEQILNAYGWSLYTKLKLEINELDDQEPETPFDSFLVELNNDEITEINLIHPSNETLNLISNSMSLFSVNSEYSPFSKLFNLSLKCEKLKSNTNWKWVEDFLVSINPGTLSTNCETVQFEKNGRLKTVELASDLETWYSYYTLALLKLGNFEECLIKSKSALDIIEKFHYNNDLWLARKIAMSNKGLGNIRQAIKEMEGIEQRKNEWFIQRELAELYFENSEFEKAERFAIKGALNFGDKEKKDGLFFLIGQIFLNKGDKEIAYKHFLLSKLIREEQEWNIPNKLKVALTESHIDGIKYDSSSLLYKHLLSLWKSINNPTPKLAEKSSKNVGKIVRVNSAREIGTIANKAENKNYFFRFRDFISSKEKIEIGATVEFKCKPPRDNNNGQDWIAFEIEFKSNGN